MNMKKYIEKTFQLLFPPICGLCNSISHSYLCFNCKKHISSLKINDIQEYNSPEFYFSERFSLFHYENEIRKLIINYKFNEKSYLCKTFSQLFKQDIIFKSLINKYDCVISVPIHKKRLSSRGYNQSKLIAKDFSLFFNKPFYDSVLIKDKNIVAQSSLSKNARHDNILNAFHVCNKELITNKTVLVFDDIFTTGATANECAKTLINAGAATVGIATIAITTIEIE